MKNTRLNAMWRLIESKTVTFAITPEFIETVYNNLASKGIRRFASDDNLYSIVGVLNDYLDRDPEFVSNFLSKLNSVGQHIIELFLNKYGLYVNQNEMRMRLLESLGEEFEVRYPIPVYVSASPEDKMTIGLYYHEDDRVEMFEGNDEATEETVKKVNRVLGGKNIRIYGSHSQKVVNDIVATNTLPANLYVSPKQDYASGYFGEDRAMFTGVVDSSYLNQESEYDWKTMEETPIQKLRLL